MHPASIAEAYWQLYRQPRDAWTFELDVRPYRMVRLVTCPAQVEFHFDFGSPNAYLAHLVVPEIEARTGVTFDYVPILLGGVFKLTNNRSPAEKMAGIKNRLAYEQLELQRFIRRHGITRSNGIRSFRSTRC